MSGAIDVSWFIHSKGVRFTGLFRSRNGGTAGSSGGLQRRIFDDLPELFLKPCCQAADLANQAPNLLDDHSQPGRAEDEKAEHQNDEKLSASEISHGGSLRGQPSPAGAAMMVP